MALEALEAATTLRFAEGLPRRARNLRALAHAPNRPARSSMPSSPNAPSPKFPDIPKDTPPYPLRKAGIIGAGTMGGGIAMALANAGIAVRIKDTTQEALDRGIATIAQKLSELRRQRPLPAGRHGSAHGPDPSAARL